MTLKTCTYRLIYRLQLQYIFQDSINLPAAARECWCRAKASLCLQSEFVIIRKITEVLWEC
jgi:hypothetical protein